MCALPRCAVRLSCARPCLQHSTLAAAFVARLTSFLTLDTLFFAAETAFFAILICALAALIAGLSFDWTAALRTFRSASQLAVGSQAGRWGRLAGQGRQGAGSGRDLPVGHAGPSGTWGRVRTWVAVFSFIFWLRRLLVACFKTLLPPATAFAAAAFTAVTVILISAFLNFSTAFFAKVLDLAWTFSREPPLFTPPPRAPSHRQDTHTRAHARARAHAKTQHSATRSAAARRAIARLGWDWRPSTVSQHSAHALTRYVSTHASTRRV
jgi:hypothetical protein